MPKQPAKSFCSTPSDSEYWTLRNLTIAWATVRLTVAAEGRGGVVPSADEATVSVMVSASLGRCGQAGVDVLLRPGAAHPGLVRMVGDLPGPLRRGAGHDVQVVHVVARRGHAGTVPAERDEDGIAVVDLLEDVDRVAGRGRGPHEAQPWLAVRAGCDLEVVDLLELGLRLRGLVVLVSRVGRPVAARGDHLAGDDRAGLERVRGGEVAHLTAGLAGPPQLDRHRRGRP